MIPRNLVLERISREDFYDVEEDWQPDAEFEYRTPNLFLTDPIRLEKSLLEVLLDTEESQRLNAVHLLNSGRLSVSVSDLQGARDNSRLREYLRDVLTGFRDGRILLVDWGREDSHYLRDRLFIHPTNGEPVGFKFRIKQNNFEKYSFTEPSGERISMNHANVLCVARPDGYV